MFSSGILMNSWRSPVATVALAVLMVSATSSIEADAWQADGAPRVAAPVERLGPNTVRIGTVTVDTAKKEVTVTGFVTPAVTLEFVAVAKGGVKAYESALELDASAVNFNLGLILIGLDSARAVVPKFHIDPALPEGDPVEIWVEWEGEKGRQRVRAEQLIYNTKTSRSLSEGPWVYTGSTIASNGGFLAEIEGSLIGFVHTPAPVIESPRPLEQGDYGSNRMNPALNLKPGTTIRLTVRALPRDKTGSAGVK